MFENVVWDDLVNDGNVPGSHHKLIRRLQQVHDRESFEDWPHRFEAIADAYNLNFHPLP